MRLRAVPLLILIVLVGIAANLIVEYAARQRQDWPAWIYLARAVALGAIAFPAVYAFYEADRRSKAAEAARRKSEGQDYLRGVLESTIRILFPSEKLTFIRANVMVVDGDELKVLCGWNMEAFPDSRLSLKYGQGVAGKVWKRAQENPMNECWLPVYAPNAQLEKEELATRWHLGEEVVRLTSHIIWILSTPLFFREGRTWTFLGVWNLDGVERRLDLMDVLEDPEFHLKCVAAAENIAAVIAERGLLG